MGELGNGQYIHQYKPVKIMSGVKYFSAAQFGEQSLAIKKDGSFWVRDTNYHSEIGNGGKANQSLNLIMQ